MKIRKLFAVLMMLVIGSIPAMAKTQEQLEGDFNKHWLWIVHPDLEPQADVVDLVFDWQIEPPVTLGDLNAQNATVKQRFVNWFGTTLGTGDLDNHTIRETTRSTPQSREFVLFPDTMDWPDEVMPYLSPNKPGT
jgi:hypothetical protein